MPEHRDLTPLDGEGTTGRVLAVGWLGKEHEYQRGPVAEAIVQRLVELLVNPWQPAYSFGVHPCPFCRISGGPAVLTYRGTTIQMGTRLLYVPGESIVYVAPSLIVHYIDAHEYAPPAEFCQAVVQCPPMRSVAYLRALLQNGLREAYAQARRT